MKTSLSRQKIVILFMALVVATLALPEMVKAQESKMITAQGVAFMQARDPAIARDEAIADGLRKAVEQAVGTLIDSETVVENFQVLSDQIYSKTKGYVRNYKVIKEWQDEDKLFYVQVSAEVTLGDLKNDLSALRLLQERKNKPRLMVMIDENNVGQVHQWLSNTNMLTAETEIVSRFRAKGFKMVDRNQARKVAKLNQVKLAVGGDASAAAAIASQTDAEVVIVGKAVSESAGNIAGSSLKSIQANISLSAVKADNAEIIASAAAHAAKPHISELSGGTAAIKAAAGKAADELIASIIENWQSEVFNATSVQIMISHIEYGKLTQFKRILQKEVRGVKSVNQRSFTNDTALLDVEVKGDAQYLADKITNMPFPGFKLVVASISQNRVDLEAKSIKKESKRSSDELEEEEPNDDMWNTNSLNVGDSIYGMIDEAGDVDYYQVDTGSKEIEIKVKIEPTGPSKLAFLVEVFDGDRNALISKTAQPGKGATFLFKTGKLFEKYFIKVSSQDKNQFDETYEYHLKLNSM